MNKIITLSRMPSLLLDTRALRPKNLPASNLCISLSLKNTTCLHCPENKFCNTRPMRFSLTCCYDLVFLRRWQEQHITTRYLNRQDSISLPSFTHHLDPGWKNRRGLCVSSAQPLPLPGISTLSGSRGIGGRKKKSWGRPTKTKQKDDLTDHAISLVKRKLTSSPCSFVGLLFWLD